MALDCKDTQADLWTRISRDEYMAYAVKECYYSIEKILYSLVDDEGRLWYDFTALSCCQLFFSCIFLLDGLQIHAIYHKGKEYLWLCSLEL